MRSSLIPTAPVVAPVTLEEAKAFLGLTGSADDAVLGLLLTDVTAQAEELTRRAFLTRAFAWTVYGPSTPRMGTDWVLSLPRVPVVAVERVTRYDRHGEAEELEAGRGYRLLGDVLRLSLPLAFEERLEVAFTAGYGEDPADVPGSLIHDLKRAVHTAYDYRADVVVGASVTHLPALVLAPFQAYRRFTV